MAVMAARCRMCDNELRLCDIGGTVPDMALTRYMQKVAYPVDSTVIRQATPAAGDSQNPCCGCF